MNYAEQAQKNVAKLVEVGQACLIAAPQPVLAPRNVESLRGPIQSTVNFVSGLANADLGSLPDAVLEPFGGAVSTAWTELQGLRDSPIVTLEAQPHHERMNRIRATLGEVAKLGVPIVAYIRISDRRTIESIETVLKGHVTKAEEGDRKIGATVNMLFETEKKAQQLLASMQQLAAETGVSEHAKDFGALAAKHEFWGGIWIGVTALLGSITGAVLCYLIAWIPLPDEAHAGQIARYIVGRVAVFTLGSYFTAWAARNYRAHRHLSVLNRHRQKALSTFQTFVGASRDEVTKNAVLLEATRCIFNAGSTGYGGEESDSSTPQIIEVVKMLTGKGGEGH